jgi:hypothetical protein
MLSHPNAQVREWMGHPVIRRKKNPGRAETRPGFLFVFEAV